MEEENHEEKKTETKPDEKSEDGLPEILEEAEKRWPKLRLAIGLATAVAGIPPSVSFFEKVISQDIQVWQFVSNSYHPIALFAKKALGKPYDLVAELERDPTIAHKEINVYGQPLLIEGEIITGGLPLVINADSIIANGKITAYPTSYPHCSPAPMPKAYSQISRPPQSERSKPGADGFAGETGMHGAKWFQACQIQIATKTFQGHLEINNSGEDGGAGGEGGDGGPGGNGGHGWCTTTDHGQKRHLGGVGGKGGRGGDGGGGGDGSNGGDVKVVVDNPIKEGEIVLGSTRVKTTLSIINDAGSGGLGGVAGRPGEGGGGGAESSDDEDAVLCDDPLPNPPNGPRGDPGAAGKRGDAGQMGWAFFKIENKFIQFEYLMASDNTLTRVARFPSAFDDHTKRHSMAEHPTGVVADEGSGGICPFSVYSAVGTGQLGCAEPH